MNRRLLLQRAGVAALAACTRPLLSSAAQPANAPILDAHIHLFNPARPGGIPWPPPNDPIYQPSLPPRYQALAQPLGIVGAIAIEASPLRSDNDWLLQTVRDSPFIVGLIANLPPTAPGFASELDRLHRDPLLLNIRHGNLWNRSLSDDLNHPSLWPNLQHLAASNLVLESANPDPTLLAALARVAQRLPQLTIVIDHLPHMPPPPDPATQQQVARSLRELASSPNVSIKLSEIPQLVHAAFQPNLSYYQPTLDHLWNLFGEDRCFFGSDWPNSDHVASLPQTLSLAETYLSQKSPTARRKFFFENSQRLYRWRPRTSTS